MLLKKWGLRLVLGTVIFAGALACRTSELFVSQSQATATATRTPRPTFTPIPPAAPTLVPTNTPLPPSPLPTIAASLTPTKRPTARPATPRPPTPVPQVIAPPPTSPPAAAKFQYAANPATCTHAGNQYIKGRVYDSSDSSANGVSGLTLALGGAGGTDPWVTARNEDDGFYTFTLAAPGTAMKPAGTYYVWILDGSGKRISDVGGPINLNPVGPDAAGTCWAGSVDFWKR